MMHQSVRLGLLAALGVLSSTCVGQFFIDGPKDDPSLNVQAPQQKPVKIMYGKGFGETKEAAEKDACRNAVECAVGTFIDSETMEKNGKMIKDEVLSHSNGFVEKHEVTGVSRTKDGFEVDVKAWVKIQEARAKLKNLAPGDTQKVGAGGLGISFSDSNSGEAARDASAAKLLAKELAQIDPVRKLVNVRLVSQKPVPLEGEEAGNVADDEGVLRFHCQFYMMRDVYFNRFMPRFTQILDQIAIHKPVTFRPLAQRTKDMYNYDGASWLKLGEDVRDKLENTYCIGMMQTMLTTRDGVTSPFFQYCFTLNGYQDDLNQIGASLGGGDGQNSTVRRGGSRARTQGRYKSAVGRIDVVTKCDDALTSVKGKAYYLAPAVYDVYRQWFMQHFGKGYNQDEGAQVDYLLRLLDEEGEELATRKVKIPEQMVLFGNSSGHDFAPSRILWGPWLNDCEYNNRVHMSTVFPIEIRVKKNIVKKVKSVTLSLAEAVDD